MEAYELIAQALWSRPQLLKDAIEDHFGCLDMQGLASLLNCSQSTIRRTELMQLAREIPGIGRRWDAAEVKQWLKAQPRGAVLRRKAKLKL